MTESNEGTAPRLGLSDQERTDIVLSFIKAYLDGKVKYHFTTAAEFRSGPEFLAALKAQYGVDYTQSNPEQIAIMFGEEIRQRIRVIGGSVEAKAEEKKEAINYLFNMIVSGRMGERIEGEFMGITTLESRLVSVEEKLASHSALLEELRMLTRLLGGSQSSERLP